MSTVAFVASTAGKGSQAVLTVEDSLFIAAGVSVVSTDAAAVVTAAPSGSHVAFVNGALVGSSGIQLRQFGENSHQSLMVRAAGERMRRSSVEKVTRYLAQGRSKWGRRPLR